MGLDNSTLGSEYAWIQSHGTRPLYINNTNNTILNLLSSNVGIGTSAPTDKLSVVGRGEFVTTLNDHGLRIRADGTNAQGILQFTDGVASVQWASIMSTPTGGGDLIFNTNLTPQTILTGLGRFGIGTLAPTEKLEVQGSVKIVDGTQGAGKVLTSDAAGKGTWQVSSGSVLLNTSLAAFSIPPTATSPVPGFSYAVPSTRSYRVEFRVWNTFTGGTIGQDVAQHVRLLKNGVVVDEYEHYYNLGNTRNTTFSVIFHATNCNAGDILSLDFRPGIATGASSIDFNTSNPWTTTKVLVFPE